MVLDSQQLIRRHLTDYYLCTAQKNPRFSVRAFAKKLGVSNSALSEILRGKRKVSLQKALLYAGKIRLPEREITKLTTAFKNSGSLEQLKPFANKLTEIIIDPGHFHIMSDWRFFAVLALVRASRGRMPTHDIAQSLELDGEAVQGIVDELIRLKVLKRERNGELVAENVVFRTSEDFPENLMKQRRLSGLEGARIALERNLPGEGGFFSTVSADVSKLKTAHEMIEDFIKRLSLFLRDPHSLDVFEININFFPRAVGHKSAAKKQFQSEE